MSEKSMTNHISEQILIDGVKAAKPSHQKALYEQYASQMFRVCLRYASDHEEAEDMLQDGFIKVFRDIAQFRSEGPLGAWIRKIMVNTALSHLRKKKDHILHVPDITTLATNYHVEGPSMESQMDAEKLLGYLQHLPQGYRTIFNLYALEGYTHEEIAEKLQISVGTSKSQLFKARDYFKRILEKKILSRWKIMTE